MASAASASISGRNRLALPAICLSALMVGLEISSIPAILPTLEQRLPASFQQLQWIMNAYTIAMTACLMAAGTLADRFGRKRVFLAGVALFGISSLACGLAASAPLLIAARFVQGIGGAVMLACQIALLSNQFPSGRERATAFGWWGIVFGAGLGFGPLVGGLTVAFVGWEWVFLVHAPLAAISYLLAQASIIESSDPDAVRIDITGIVTLSLTVFCLVYLITRGQPLHSDDPAGLIAAIVGATSLLLFVIVERTVARPMIDFAVFRIPNFSGALLGSAGMNFSFWPFVIYLPIYFQAGLGYDSVTAGFALLAYTLPTLIAPPFGERLLLRHGPRIVLPLGLFIVGSGFLTMWLATMSAYAGWMTILPGCVLAGTGVGLMNTPVTNTATASVPAGRAGVGSGMDMSARMISLAINIALMGSIFIQGIRASLTRVQLKGGIPAALADVIAAGNLSTAETAGVAEPVARQALVHGFSWVMLYALASAWLLAVLSWLVMSVHDRQGRGHDASASRQM